MRSLLFVVALVICTSAARAADLGPVRLDLGGPGWEFRQSDKPGDVTPATVPGTVHTDLLAANKLPDPFYRLNEASLQWIGTTAWSYSRHFNVPAELLRRHHVELRCDGLETLAHVFVNGQRAGDADNMFRIWAFDVRPLLRTGDNELRVDFDPLKPFIVRQVADAKGKGRGLAVNGMGEVRVEPCCNGWDFGPRFVTYGIWKPIGVIAWDGGRLGQVKIAEDLSDPKAAKLAVDVKADVDGTVPLRAVATVSFGGRPIDSQPCDVASDGTGHVTLTVPDPQRWWPNGMGDQPMYDVTVELTANGQPIDRTARHIGLRTVDLLPKSADRPLRLAVNGREIFAKGVDWIPCDVFPTRVTAAKLQSLVADAKLANMNMIRCWGGGYYEEDALYDACDAAGILVWAEFKFACSAYPVNDPAFIATVAAEADDYVDRVRHHPCIAVWSGNNEVRAIVERYGILNEAEYGKLFHDLLGGAVRRGVPNAAYVGGSPEAGDEHNWWVWHVGASFEKYLDGHGWMTEFGFQSFPEPRTVATFTEAGDRDSVESPVMKFHQRNGNGRGNAMITEMMGRYFRPARDFDSALWLSQINQAMGVSLGVRHWRADWPRSSGSLLWQLDEIWTGPTWSCVDYLGRWKAVMYRLRHDYAPVVIDAHADPRGGTVTADVANDGPGPVDATLHWMLTNAAGTEFDGGAAPVHISAGTSAARVWSHDFSARLDTPPHAVGAPLDRRNALLWLDLTTTDGRTLAAQTVLFAKPKQINLTDAMVTRYAVPAGDGYDVTVTVGHPALYLWLDVGADAHYSDNFVDVRPGLPVTIHVTPAVPMSADAFRAALKVCSLYDTYDPRAASAQLVAQRPDGSIVATAAAAEIVGDTAVLEAGNPPNIGGWTDAHDSLRWTVHVDRPGSFAVSAETALPAFGGPEGTYAVAIGDEHVDGTVRHTGGWQDYRTADVGTIRIAAAGDVTVTLRPTGRTDGNGVVMNFRSLTLRPVAEAR